MLFRSLIVFCYGGWSIPIEVIPSYERVPTLRAVFTDNSNGISHILWCHNSSLELHYRQLSANGTLSEINGLPWPIECKYNFILDGLHDGKTLYIIFQRSRVIASKDSCDKNNESCIDIYFAQSQDNGKLWSKSIAVPRKNMKDKLDRVNPKFLKTNQNRLWIFYKKSTKEYAPISYVTLAPGSSIFSFEKDLNIIASKKYSVAYNKNETKSITGIFVYSKENYKYHRYYSDNNGLSWNGPYDLDDCCKGDSIAIFPFNSLQANSYLFAICRDFDFFDFLSISSDMGAKWRIIFDYIGNDMDRYSIIGDEKGNGIFAYCESSIHYAEFNSKEFKEVSTPPALAPCVALTSIYKNAKHWFWYEVKRGNMISLWMTSIEINQSKF